MEFSLFWEARFGAKFIWPVLTCFVFPSSLSFVIIDKDRLVCVWMKTKRSN